jgi:hypothetical protein
MQVQRCAITGSTPQTTFLHHILFCTNSNTLPQTAAEQEKAKQNLLSALKAISAAYEGSGGPFFLGIKPSYADFHWFPWTHRFALMMNDAEFRLPFNPSSITKAWSTKALPQLLCALYP